MEVRKQLWNISCLRLIVQILIFQYTFTSAAKLNHLHSHQGEVLYREHQQQDKVGLLPNQRASNIHQQPRQEKLSVLTYTFKEPNNLVNDSVGIDCGNSHHACDDDKTCCPLEYKCCPSQSSDGMMACCKAGMDAVCCEKQPHQENNHCCYNGGVCVTDEDQNDQNIFCDYPFALKIKYKWLYKDYEDPGRI